ncbi:glucose-6-phosphate dehydrogenase, partial [Patescibacteria group bacterium]|nr:glucose-6-phosphate dehydrogenase [Patescibacteria group bacterium]
MKKENLKNIPTVFIIFGATGDLVFKKLAPALFHLFEHGRLPGLFSVIGFSRQNLSNQDFRRQLKKAILKHLGLKKNRRLDDFLNYFSYQSGHFEKRQDYQKLAQRLGQIDGQWKVCANKLFYLAVPPQYYEGLFRRLASSGLTKPCSPAEGWTRVLVEKPFGRDLKTAQKLDRILGQLFKEEQIYRIDHYLAKEMLQNILSFRFANNLFEKSWNHHLIESIEIKLLENIGVEDRGDFYDGVGALQDVGQNHLLQMLALITMDHPLEFKANTIRRKRAEALKSLKLFTQTQVKRSSFRAQYQGYGNIKGVKKKSKTETYFKIKAFLNSFLWQGVPIILESGKKLKDRKKEIIITFKHSSPCFCPPKTKIHFKNKLIFHLEPQEGITIQFWSKKPGLKFELQERKFNFLYRKKKKKFSYTEEYEKLLLDCISGDQTLFISTEEVESMWKFIDPFIKAWRHNLVPLKRYSQNTNTIRRESKVIESPLISDLTFKKEIALIGLGKMGGNIAQQLMGKGWLVLGYNRTTEVTRDLEKKGLIGAYSLQELTQKFSSPRIIWLMVPAGQPVEEVIFARQGLIKFLKPGDIIIDGGNSFYRDSIRRSKKLAK